MEPSKAWEIFEQSYGGINFGGIFKGIDILSSITYDSFNCIEAYSNAFRASTATLERQNLLLDTQYLAALYLRGLGAGFHQVRWDAIMTTEKVELNKIIEKAHFAERTLLPVTSNTKREKSKPASGTLNDNSSSNQKPG